MKKTYSKPEILFENFSLNTSIAGGCEVVINTFSSGNCGIKFGDLTIFVSQTTGSCNFTDGVLVEGDDGSYNNVCYHVPNGNSNYFNSL